MGCLVNVGSTFVIVCGLKLVLRPLTSFLKESYEGWYDSGRRRHRLVGYESSEEGKS